MSVIDLDRTSTQPRVALLASDGRARQQLREALLRAGAEIALEEDPNAIGPEALSALAPHAVLVALEPAIEDALARLDEVLGDPALMVIYDEAELAASREGWDAQRWARHLAAKLHRHRDVLPPGLEPEPPQAPEPGRPQPAPVVSDELVEQRLEEAAELAVDLPQDPMFEASFDLVHDADAGQAADAFSIDAENWTAPEQPERLALVDDLAIASPEPATELPPPLPAAPAVEAPAAPEAAPSIPSFANLSLVEDFQVQVPVRAAPAGAPVLPPGLDHLTFELEALEGEAAATSGPVVEEPAGSRVPGAVLLLAGIGGPDAVRRVLSRLTPEFGVPVLVQLRLDGGRYDNLARQMERASPLPVLLARSGMAARSGYVYVVPDDVAAVANDGLVEFTAGLTNMETLLGALPANRTAVFLLSGSAVEHVEPVLMLGARGALVGGQSLQGCYDWAASKALEQGGGQTDTPEALSERMVQILGS